MAKNMIYKMTDEIAYKLGKFDFPAFYSFVLWKVNKEPFELAVFFDWSMGAGWPLKGRDYKEIDWENINLWGKLKTAEIKDISHKLAYIRGRLTSYSVRIESNRIYVGYANSYDLRDFLTDCFDDVIKDKFVYEPQKEGGLGRRLISNYPKYTLTKGETVGKIPGTPYVNLEADEEIIKYIVGNV